MGDRRVRVGRERGRVVDDGGRPFRQATAAPADGLHATTVLWNTGAPTLGQGSPITSMEALAQVVTLPGPTAIAARTLGL